MGELSLRLSQIHRIAGVRVLSFLNNISYSPTVFNGTCLQRNFSNKRITAPFLLFLCCLGINACSLHKSTRFPTISVTAPAEHRMHFSGKGAGAGMMMAASMGPMGIAIGVAIDEGIAKDIGKAASRANVDVPLIVKAAFENAFVGTNEKLEVHLLEYGFVTKPGAEGVEDPVVANIKLRVNENEEALISSRVCDLQARELAQVKADGVVVREAFEEAAGCLAGLQPQNANAP